jgi:hypothetical protein
MTNGLRWGNQWLPMSAATQHWLAVGTTGSGKSLIQRRLMREPLLRIQAGTDSRALIFDAKNDITAYLRTIGVDCPIYSLNPFDAGTDSPISVAWKIAADVTSSARAQNLVTSLIPNEKGGTNAYFTDAARQVVIAVVESLIRHSPGVWTFADVVFACLNQSRTEELLRRDSEGQDTLQAFFGDERTAYQVFTTISSRMSYYKTVAALWQRATQSISIRGWLQDESILLLGSNATAKTSLDAINEQIFRVFTEEVDVQSNSGKRKTWVWIDEARLAGPILKSDLLPFLAVKGRSRGIALVLAFQDMEGMKEAAGERIANELVAQMSNKALLRMESDGSAAWASRLLGQYETIEYFTSETRSAFNQNVSGQRVVKDAVLPSEFYQLPVTNRQNGLTGYFVSPSLGASRQLIQASELREIVTRESTERQYSQKSRPESDQWIREWRDADRERLVLQEELAKPEVAQSNKRGRLKLFGGNNRDGDILDTAVHEACEDQAPPDLHARG